MDELSSSASLHIELQAARKQSRAGAGAVMDVLVRSLGIGVEALSERLVRDAGVATAHESDGLNRPDFSRLDRATARQWRCVVLDRNDTMPLLAAEDPWDHVLIQRASRHVGMQLRPAATTRAALSFWLGELAGGELIAGDKESTGKQGAVAMADGPIVDFVDSAVRAAFRLGASDVHCECDRWGVTIKLRTDGVLTRYARLDGELQAQEVISRIKVLAQLDITERRAPQDGRFRFKLGDTSIDLRVSIMPSVFGEDAVLRLLDKAQLRSREASITLEMLGFDASEAEQIRDLASRPSGMLLVTGPTGSGKTTTIYALLSEINTGLEKIITIEDPVEYELPGVLQIPVNERKGLTFAKGLRSILRHDPDRILVGEIRDPETAEIAVQSSLTGHLVFTTVHANGISDIVGRFRHFGMDMFGFMSSLNGVVVQRLVRQLCTECSTDRPALPKEQEWLARMLTADVLRLPSSVGCNRCHGTGYRGRFVIAETHQIDDEFRDLVTEGAPVSALKAHAARQRIASLATQAASHVLARRTTMEEVKRVVGWP